MCDRCETLEKQNAKLRQRVKQLRELLRACAACKGQMEQVIFMGIAQGQKLERAARRRMQPHQPRASYGWHKAQATAARFLWTDLYQRWMEFRCECKGG